MRLSLRPTVLYSGLAVALLVNIVVAGLYLWSRDGQTTVVAVRNDGSQYSVLVDGTPVDFPDEDGNERLEPRLNGPPGGTIRLVPNLPLPTFPSPGGIDSVKVLRPDGEVLFEDAFDDLDATVWQVDSGSFEVHDGILVPQEIVDGGNAITLRGEGWSGDYVIEVTYRNSRGGVIGSHVAGGTGVFYHFELIRDFPSFFDAVDENGKREGFVYGSFVHTDSIESTRASFAMLLEPYPYVLAALLAGAVITFALAANERFVRPRVRIAMPSWWGKYAAGSTAAVIALGCMTVTLVLAHDYYGVTPHYPDEVMYGFQAKMLAAGRLTTEIYGPSDAYFIQTIKPSFIDDIGEWATFYPFGHPLALAIGALLGAMWLVPPVIGAGTVFLTFVLGRRFWGAAAGLAGALMMAISPFVWMQSGNLLSHNTGTLYILLALLFIVKRDRPWLYGALAGLFFGLGVNTRPLNMAFLVLPYGALLLGYLWQDWQAGRRWRELAPWFQHTGAFVAMVVLLVAAMFAYNWGVTGSLETTYAGGTGGSSSELYGFRDGHTVDVGIRNMQALHSTLLLVVTGWPSYAGLAFVLLPFLLGTKHRWDYFVLACALIQMLAYAGYRFSGVFEGPRYWYEAMPFLALLAGRGIVLVAALLNRVAAAAIDWLGRAPRARPATEVRLAGPLVVGTLVAYLIVSGTGGWLFGWKAEADAHNVPYQASEMKTVFDFDPGIRDLAEDFEVENALVLVEPCGVFRSSHCLSSVFLRNNVDFDGDVVWLYYIEDEVDETIAAFPDRDVYIASWDPPAIVPYEE